MSSDISFQDRLYLIQRELKKRKITQKQLADRLSLKQPIISNILKSKTPARLPIVLKIIRALELPIEKIFPNLQSQLTVILSLMEDPEKNNECLMLLIELVDLQKHYTGIDDDTTTETTKPENRV